MTLSAIAKEALFHLLEMYQRFILANLVEHAASGPEEGVIKVVVHDVMESFYRVHFFLRVSNRTFVRAFLQP